MRENLFRLAFWILMVLAVLVFGRGIVRAEASIVTANVYPRVAIINPYKRATFRFRWSIEPHEQNRRYAVMYTCGSEVHSSQGEINGQSAKTTERYVDLTVLEDCTFMACVVRIVEGKPKTMCDWVYVRTSQEVR